jgi:uncharacterized protein (TIGR01777 family)
LREAFTDVRAVIHLAGENVASWFWTEKQKNKIYDSRTQSTQAIVTLMSQLCDSSVPLFSASAIGIYPSRDTSADETQRPGEGFLPSVVEAWEAEALVASKERQVTIGRIGLVLSGRGGLLERMLPIFRLGLGGKLGNGQHFMSWIDLGDLCRAIVFLVTQSNDQGIFNLVAPEPVRNQEFTQVLARQLQRPAILPVPRFVLRMIFGKAMCDELFFSNINASSAKLEAAGFEFQHPTLEASLRYQLGDSAK